MDTLSEVLRAVRLTGAVYFSIDGSTPWVVETPPGIRAGRAVILIGRRALYLSIRGNNSPANN